MTFCILLVIIILLALVISLQSGLTALIVAAFKGHTAALQSLLSAGADMNIQDKVSTAPQPEIHPHTCNHVLACGSECCLILMQNGCTALIVAVNEKKFEAAEVLIKVGAGLSQEEEVMAKHFMTIS